jgi:hypothetical protein
MSLSVLILFPPTSSAKGVGNFFAIILAVGENLRTFLGIVTGLETGSGFG